MKKRISLGTTSRRPVSPLAGLVEEMKKLTPEQRAEIFRKPTPEEKKLRDTVRLLKAMFTVAKSDSRGGYMLRMYPKHDNKDFEWIDFGEREPGETFAVAEDGRVIRHTCQYSGHNGDSYDDKYFDLKGEEAQKVLDALASRMEGLALAAEERRLEEAAVRRKAMAAKQNLRARLKSKGLI